MRSSRRRINNTQRTLLKESHDGTINGKEKQTKRAGWQFHSFICVHSHRLCFKQDKPWVCDGAHRPTIPAWPTSLHSAPLHWDAHCSQPSRSRSRRQRGLDEKAGERGGNGWNDLEAAVNTHLPVVHVTSHPPHLPSCSSVESFCFLSDTEQEAQTHRSLKKKSLYSCTKHTHKAAHMQHNKDMITHTPLLESLRMESLDALNNPPSLFYWSQHYLCILHIHSCHLWRGPSLCRNFFNSRMHTTERKCKLPILSSHRKTQQIRRWHFWHIVNLSSFPLRTIAC